ncbi:hypothetical protein KM043_016160 [Ampulex compressa]|nr:hypothetical protein KM043_016160 [Ampulex compressa]
MRRTDEGQQGLRGGARGQQCDGSCAATLCVGSAVSRQLESADCAAPLPALQLCDNQYSALPPRFYRHSQVFFVQDTLVLSFCFVASDTVRSSSVKVVIRRRGARNGKEGRQPSGLRIGAENPPTGGECVIF